MPLGSVGGQPELAPAQFALALGAADFLIALRDLTYNGPDCRVIAGITQLFGCREDVDDGKAGEFLQPRTRCAGDIERTATISRIYPLG